MTRLVVYSAASPAQILLDTEDFDVITREVAAVGARFERWEAARPLAPGATQDEILDVYSAAIDRLKRERGYASADVVRIRPDTPNWPALRQKFLAEHTHSEDEVRFFVEGSGAFYLHIGDKVLEVVGTAGDLLSVPQGTPHWFDGGPVGDFTCIRLFSEQSAWVAQYTGAPIADAFPRYNDAA